MQYSQNPFITSAEVYNDEDFFNREQVLHAVDKFIKRKNDYNFLIFGQRRIGKTSTLKRIHKLYNDNQNIVLYYNLQGDAETTLPVLLSKIIKLISSNLGLNKSYFEIATEDDFLDVFLPELNSYLIDKQLIILFDEFDVLGERENITALKQTYSFHKFVDFIPNIIEKIKDYKIPLKLIFAIGRNYKDLDNERFGQVTKFGQQVEVTFFNKEIVFRLLEQLSNGISFTSEAKERLWQLSGGQPYFTQCLASFSYESAEDEGLEFISKDIVEKSFLPTVKRYSSGVLWIWDTLISVDKIILYLIAELTDNKDIVNTFNIKKIAEQKQLLPSTKKLDETLNRLVNIKFLEEINSGQYVFKSDFFRKWINTQIGLQDLQKYFSNFDTEIKNLLTNARFYFNEEQNYTEALKFYEQVLKYDNSNTEAQFYAGKCYVLKSIKTVDDYKKALLLFKKSYNPIETIRNDFIKDFLTEFFQKCSDKEYKNERIVSFYKKIVTELEFENSIFKKGTGLNFYALSDYKPSFEWDFKNNIQVKYRFNRIVEPEFVVKVFFLIIENEQNYLIWKKGIFINNLNIEFNNEFNEMLIRVKGKEKQSKLKEISLEFEKNIKLFSSLTAQKLIQCNCNVCSDAKKPNFYEISDLKRRVEKGKKTVECKVSYHDVDVKSLLKLSENF